MNTLLENDLVDEYQLMIFPLVVGSGKRLFWEGLDKTVLKLVDTRTFGSGVMVLTYQRLASEKGLGMTRTPVRPRGR